MRGLTSTRDQPLLEILEPAKDYPEAVRAGVGIGLDPGGRSRDDRLVRQLRAGREDDHPNAGGSDLIYVDRQGGEGENPRMVFPTGTGRWKTPIDLWFPVEGTRRAA